MRATAAAGVALALLPGAAQAVLPDEIQVYLDDLNDPGELGLQLHINTTPSGDTEPHYSGESVAAHGWRTTAEFAYGVTSSLEAGAYLPVVREAGGPTRVAGGKLRLKWVPLRPPEDGSGWFAGLNGELSEVQYRFEEERRNFELRPILGWRDATWLFAVNPVLEHPLAGPDRHHAPDFAPSFKVGRTVTHGISTGVEYYVDAGSLDRVEFNNQSQQTLYWALDIDRKPLELNFGIGRGLTSETDRWTIKMIVTIPL